MSIFECVQSVGGACLLPERGTGDGALERVSKFIPAKCAAHLTESNFQLLFTRLCSARCFRAHFARKSRVARRETAFFAVSVHREACYCSQHAAFGRWVNSNNFQPRSSYFLFFFRCISQITPRPKQRIQTTTETAIKGQKLERYEPSPVSLIRRFRPSAAPLLSPAPAKAAVSVRPAAHVSNR